MGIALGLESPRSNFSPEWHEQDEQVVENVAVAEYSKPHNLTVGELTNRARSECISLIKSDFLHCMQVLFTLPNGVDIPRVFEFYNDAIVYNSATDQRKMYNNAIMFKEENRADRCIQCDQCLEKCPQKLQIPDLLEKAHKFLIGK